MLKIIMEYIVFFVELIFEGWITLHQMGFEMFWGCITNFKTWGLGSGLLGALTLLAVLLMDLAIICLLDSFYTEIIKPTWIAFKTKEVQRYNVVATVTEKEYRRPYTSHSTFLVGKVPVHTTHRHKEKHFVHVNYQNMSVSFDNKTLFDSINVNDNINLVLVHMLDKNNKIIETLLELPE